MATIIPVITVLSGYTPYDGWMVVWGPIGDADVCQPVTLSNYTDQSAQVDGTFGGATLTIQGSNDATNYHTKTDPTGTAISLTQSGLRQCTEATINTKPVTSGGTGSALTVTMFMSTKIRP